MFLSKIRVNFRCNTHFCPFNITQRPHAHPIDMHKPSTAQVMHKVCHVPAAHRRPCILEHRCAENSPRKEGAKVTLFCIILPSHRTAFLDAQRCPQKRSALHRPTHSTSSPLEEHSDRHRTALHFSTNAKRTNGEARDTPNVTVAYGRCEPSGSGHKMHSLALNRQSKESAQEHPAKHLHQGM